MVSPATANQRWSTIIESQDQTSRASEASEARFESEARHSLYPQDPSPKQLVSQSQVQKVQLMVEVGSEMQLKN